ncbi:Hypothetical predicted protein [Cloeon dipterum]|uniref:C-type lectin domain-containing protein n=1 Tax=Cloeon dipterum TaxID=197152 RepID=A0A8S1E1N7_9INSE|nr:Hypothetical predicted protein [Cloeon dipterum]
MNFLFMSIVLFSTLLIIFGDAILLKKHNLRRVKGIAGARPKTSRRMAIIKCCGIKRCLPKSGAKRPQTTMREISKLASSLPASLNRTFASTGSSSDVNVAPTFTEPNVDMTDQRLDSSSITIGDTSEGTEPIDIIEITTTQRNIVSANKNSPTPAVASTFRPVFESNSSALTTGISVTTTSSSSAVTTTTEVTTKSSPLTTGLAKTMTQTTFTTIKAVTTTSTTTTTIAPKSCSMMCKDFDKFLLGKPTSKPSSAEGSVLTATLCKKKYFISSVNVARNEAGLRCKAMDMSLLAVTSVEELNCLASLKTVVGSFWTGGSNVDEKCESGKKYGWCSTGHNMSSALVSLTNFWMPSDVPPSSLENCLAVLISSPEKKGMVHKNCDDLLPYICQFAVNCPKTCTKNTSLFDTTGNLMNKTSYGIWIDIGKYTYLLGNKPMNWEASWRQCCALGMQTLKINDAVEQAGLTNMTVVLKDDWKANFNYWTSGTWKGAPVGEWSWCDSNGPTILDQGLTWESGQPDNKNGNESCIHFRFVLNSTGTILTDRNCASKYIYACKMPILTTRKPCVASCPNKPCQRNLTLFGPENVLLDYPIYGEWYSGCGRNFLFYNITKMDWGSALDLCCSLGLTLTSLESADKTKCFSKIVTRYAPLTVGDFWLSGTDLGCDSNFRWCSLGRDFVDPELRWKQGHPKAGLDCVYVEARNGSMMLASANCDEQKLFVCEVRKKGTSQVALQNECLEIWQITSAELDLLSNAAAFLTANISLELKCFLKCIGVKVGMFDVGGLNAIAMLRQAELASMEEPEKLEQGFVAFDECSGKNADDECVTAYDTYKCGLEKTPDLVSNMVSNNLGSGPVIEPPTPCILKRRTCWLSNSFPCVSKQSAIDLLNSQGSDDMGAKVTFQSKTYYVGNYDGDNGNSNPVTAFQRCCELGMRLYEPQTLADFFYARDNITVYPNPLLILGETEFINKTHEVWCRSRTLLTDDMLDPNPRLRYPCDESIVSVLGDSPTIQMFSRPDLDIHDYYINPHKYPTRDYQFQSFICEPM